MKQHPIVLFILLSVFLILGFQNCGGSDGGKTALSSVNRLGEDFAPKQIIMRMKSKEDLDAMYAWADREQLTLEYEWQAENENMALFTWTKDINVPEQIEEMKLDSLWSKVDFAEPNFILRTPGDSQDLPELLDPENGEISGTSLEVDDISRFDETSRNQRAYAATGVDTLQGEGDSNNPILVAVIDTGLDVNHSFFIDANALWQNEGDIPGDGIDNDGNGFVDDTNGWNFANGTANLTDDDGHGTHCAGIVLGVGNDILSTSPAASPIQIMGLKFIDENGGRTSDAIRAIDYAVANGAQVLSNSWGGGGFSEALQRSLANASNRGVFIAIAAGNDFSDNDRLPVYPANISVPNSLTVAATDNDDRLASFSNFGVESVQIAAPGVRILSTYPSVNGVGRYNFLSGTSMATPFVAGAGAMILNGNPSLTGFDVKSIIIENADSISGLSNAVASSGRLSAGGAKQVAVGASSRGEQPQDPGQVNGQVGRDPAGNGSSSDGGGGCGVVIPSSPNPPGPGGGSLALLLIPLLLLAGLRRPALARGSKAFRTIF